MNIESPPRREPRVRWPSLPSRASSRSGAPRPTLVQRSGNQVGWR